ncbi:hypothetical protein CSE16_01670 [Solibacillus sp. R5-41]|uniref:hypothetical protein n=1 Tax=Solibacillus sp. R5-41 TaxID=2048654 RepID=UPI000C125595|nr:hypothetical protein [Solibacillus sp. R5-41]ATP38825.1 hypothetical protein CSE16_01670 [Solibacillus sp. R5-41]
MHKYKFLTNCGVNLKFESKFHIDDLTPVVFTNAVFVRFEDVEIVVKLTEIMNAEVNGVEYQIKSYAV